MIKASAPAKIILCGEHAAVYNRPATALPLGDLRAFAEAPPGEAWSYIDQPDHPLSELAAAGHCVSWLY